MPTISLLVAAAVAAALPAPGPTIERTPAGRWSTAYGFEPVARGATAEASARAFVALHADDLGMAPRHALALESGPTVGQAGVVRFRRLVDGWPVFGGGVALAVDAAGAVLAVSAGDVEPAATGRFALSRAEAVDRAVLALGGPGRVTLPAALRQGWARSGAEFRAAYQVDVGAVEGPDSWRVTVDAEDGRLLFRQSRLVHAQGRVYDISPVEYYSGTAATLCPLVGGSYTTCVAASPVLRTLADLPPGATSLAGSVFSVFNCRGNNIPAGTGGCDQTYTPAVPAGGNFDFPAHPDDGAKTEDFAAVMAYYHLTQHIEFLRAVDPSADNLTHLTPSPAMPALVNGYSGGQPYANAFFDPSSAVPGVLSGRMVFGQDTNADFAYDASIMYHELTHGVVEAWGGFNDFFDVRGVSLEGGASNEGTADAMAMAHTRDPRMSTYTGQYFNGPGSLGLRVMGQRLATCQNLTGASYNGGIPILYGLDGEVHDDGEIWGNFFWEVFDGLKDVPACGGSCSAGAAIQYRALQLAAGNTSAFGMKAYADNFKAAAASLFPGNTALQTFVQCAYDRHEMGGCDRTLPLYAPENSVQYVDFRYSAFQVVVETSGPTTIGVCHATGSTVFPAKVWVRNGQPVVLTTPSGTGTTVAPGSTSTDVTLACTGGRAAVSLPSAGTWYVLLDVPSTWTVSPAWFLVTANGSATVSRPAHAEVPACVYTGTAGGPTVTPATVTVPPRATQTFAASGGSGTGYTWAIATNGSGGNVTAGGLYTAGATPNVSDVVRVTDDAAGIGTATVTVGPGASISPAAPTVAPAGGVAFSASGGSGTGYSWTLTANPSGGSITTGGVYTAGSVAGTVDVVRVADSLGNTASAGVTVTAATPPPPAGSSGSSSKSGCGCATGDSSLGLLALLPLLPRRRRRAPLPDRE